MKIFRYTADRIPVFLFASLFCFDLFLYLQGATGIFFWIYCLISLGIKGFICAWNHHHQHVNTFHIPLLNRMLEIMYGFQTGAIWYAWVLHHNLWHHLHYQDQSKDESAWKSPKGERYGALMYTWMVSVTSYYRSWKVGKKHKKIQKYFLYMSVIQGALLALLIFFQPLQGVLLFGLPMVTGIFLTVYTTYHHHSGLESDDPHLSSYNIVTPWYNKITGNLGYHTAHHIRGSLHWSKLPELHKSIKDKIPDELYKRYNLLWYSQGK